MHAWRHWQRDRGTDHLVSVVALLILAASLSGCQNSTRSIDLDPSTLGYAASADSLGVMAFQALPSAEQHLRAGQAASWRRRADSALRISSELRALRTAVGLDPTHADTWLRLALRCRWFGDYQQTEDALAGFGTALPYAVEPHRHVLAARAALCAAWLRYDRGEWKRGLAWVDSAAAHRIENDDEIQLLRALLLAGTGHHRRAEDVAYRFANRDHRAHWIYGVSYWRRGGPEPAHGIFTGVGGQNVSHSADFVTGAMRPGTVRAAECYRDFAIVEELVGNWWLARRRHEDAMRNVPGIKRAAVVRRDIPPLGQSAAEAAMPVWLAFDRYYVTGSISAFTALAHDRYQRATDPVQREHWASAVLDAAGTCVRLDIDTAWARRARGLVLANFVDQRSQARHDLTQALRAFDRVRRQDLELLATLGHLHLKASQPARARPLLERAAKIGPSRARIWSDLGLAFVQLGEPNRALPAFEEALTRDPTLAVAWYNRGLLRFHLDDLEGAVSDLERAHELAPDDRSIASLLAQLVRQTSH